MLYPTCKMAFWKRKAEARGIHDFLWMEIKTDPSSPSERIQIALCFYYTRVFCKPLYYQAGCSKGVWINFSIKRGFRLGILYFEESHRYKFEK